MQRNQWKTASEQLLKHWQRCGISHIPSSSPEFDSKTSGHPKTEEWLREHAAVLFDSIATTAEPVKRIEPIETVSERISGPSFPLAVRENSPVPGPKSTAAPKIATAPATKTPVPIKSKSNLESIGEYGNWTSKVLNLSERAGVLTTLNEQANACRKCEDIVCQRQRTVFGVGAPNARVAMFGEAPGADEDRIGEPFVGAAGQLLDKILVASGLKRPEVYILNALKCRPPSNRTPTDIEIENCRPFFESQLEAIQPEYIVCWGSVAVRAVLKSTESVGRLRGKFHAFRGSKVLVTYHPAYLLRNPDAKRLTWEDMKMLIKEMGLQIPGKSG